MRKLSTTYMLLLLVSLVLVSGATGGIVMLQSVQVLQAHTEETLVYKAITGGRKLEQTLGQVENQVSSVSAVAAHHLGVLLEEGYRLSTPLSAQDKAIFEKLILEIRNLTISTANLTEDNINLNIALRPDLFPAGDTEAEYPYQVMLTRTKEGTLTSASTRLTSAQLLRLRDETVPWYHSALDRGAGIWSDPYLDPFLTSTLITYSEPILLDGQIVGVIGIDMDFESIRESIQSVRVYDTGYAFLFDRRYRFIAHPTLGPDQKLHRMDDGRYGFMREAMEQSKSGALQYVFKNTNKVLGYYRMSNGWIYAVGPPISEVFEDLGTIQRNMMYALAFGILVIGGIAFIIGLRVSKPLEELSGHVTQYIQSKEPLSKPIPPHLLASSNEVGHLSRALENLRLDLEKAFDQINGQKSVLDQTVQERTRQLEETNRELAKSIETLEATQNLLVEARKQEALNNLIQNLAHKLNTPIGNAITASSFLLRELDDRMRIGGKDNCYMSYDELEQIRDTAHLIYQNQNSLKVIVESLRELMNDYSDKTSGKVHIYSFIQGVAENVKTMHRTDRLTTHIQIDKEWEITSYPGLLSKLFENLFTHSVHMAMTQDTQATVRVSAEIAPGTMTFVFLDSTITTEVDIGRIFDPFFVSAFTQDDSGLELQIAYKLVTQGLGGSISAHSRDDNQVEIRIEMPVLIG